MSSKANRDLLEQIHGQLAAVYLQTLQRSIEEDYPLDAATLSAMGKFLKDNDTVADPASSASVSALRDKLKEQSKARTISNVIELAKRDIAPDAMTG